MSTSKNVILVTGGTGAHSTLTRARASSRILIALPASRAGLVGAAIDHVTRTEPVGSRFGKFAHDDQWVFLSSKDGDLR